MKKIVFFLCVFFTPAKSQLIKELPSWTTYSSKGLCDHRGGFSIYSVSKVNTLKQNRQIHLSIGSSLFVHTLAGGVKFNFDSPFKFFSRSYVVTSFAMWALPTQTSESMNLRVVPTISLGVEKDLSDKSSVSIGLLLGGSASSGDTSVDTYFSPSLSYIKRW